MAKLEHEGASAVVVGPFNPAIMQPYWLARSALIMESEAASATIDIIRPELSVFTVGGFKLQAQQNRLQIDVVDPTFQRPLRDLVIGICKLLEHVPINQIGVNRHGHYRTDTLEKRHGVGHSLVPKENWDGVLENVGTLTAQVRGSRPGAKSTHVDMLVQPSSRVIPGVYIGYLEQYDFPDGFARSAILERFADDWDEIMRYSRIVSDKLLSNTGG